MGLVPRSFEYKLLNDKTRTIVWERTSEIKNLMRLTAENIISIGQKLTEVKEELEHGTFQSWLRTEFEWSEQTARQFMQVYRWSRTLENKNFVFSQLGTSALYLLAAPSTPPEARKEVLDLVEIGEKITYTRTKTIVDRHKNLLTIGKAEIVDVTGDEVEEVAPQQNVLEDIVEETTNASNQLFRLQTEAIGCIVRLYKADELKSATELKVGAIVTINVGRWRGQTANIIEVLTDIQPSTVSSQEREQILNPCKLQTNTMKVCSVDRTDLFDRETLPFDESLIISYGEVNLAITGHVEKLQAFTRQIQTNTAFVEKIFERALDIATPNIEE